MSFVSQDTVKIKSIAERSSPILLPPPPIGTRRRKFTFFRWLFAREAVANFALVILMIAVVWGSIWLHLMQQRKEIAARAATDSSNLAQAAAESIGQTITGIDDAMRFIRAIYVSDPQHFDIGVWARRANKMRGVAPQFVIIGRDGMLADSSLGPVETPTDLSSQAFYKEHLGDAEDRLFVSQPIRANPSSRWSLVFTRKVAAADGWFMGVIAASVDPSWLTRLYQALDIGHGTLMFVGADGFIRAMATASGVDAGHGIGQDLSHSALLAAAANADRGTVTWLNPVDGTEQIVSFRKLPDYASLVAVGLDSQTIFAPYRHYAQQYEIFGACLTLLILITGYLLLSNTRRLLVSRQVLKDTMDAMSQGILMIDPKGRIQVINRRANELLQPSQDHVEAEQTPLKIDHRLSSTEKPGAIPRRPTEMDGETMYELVCADGTVLEVRTHALGNGGTVRTYTDITERKNAEAQIIHLALHDSLTGLPNRRLFAERLAEAISRVAHGSKGCSMLWLDLDKFKDINDLRGHGFGDQVLIQVADRLRSLARPDDVVARLGGDEFCILRDGNNDPAASEALARQVLDLLSAPYEIDGQRVVLSASVGMALCPADGSSLDQLLANADAALYRAKQDGRSTFRLYEPEMDTWITERRLLEQDLANALELHQLSVAYQPIFNAASQEVVGFEALLRWSHPTRGNVSPEVFIPVAEESGLIVKLGNWVMETACAEAARWPKSLRVSVNFSPKQFWELDIPKLVASILAKTGFPAERLTLEITEGVFIAHGEQALSIMSELKKQGVQVSLDDFGTGYSSLSYLRRFPFDAIKIDKSFVKTLSEDEGARAIVQAVLTLGHSLKLKVVAEGVEHPAQIQWLRAAGCNELQGFLLGRPMPSDSIHDFLQEAETALSPEG